MDEETEAQTLSGLCKFTEPGSGTVGGLNPGALASFKRNSDESLKCYRCVMKTLKFNVCFLECKVLFKDKKL